MWVLLHESAPGVVDEVEESLCIGFNQRTIMHSVLVLGSGGRNMPSDGRWSVQGAQWSCTSPRGNAGTAIIGTNHSVSITDLDAVLHLVTELSIDLVVVGPEAPLVAGVANRLRSSGISVVGPDADLAHLEG